MSVARTFLSGALSDILGQHHNYSNKPLQEVGYCLLEFKRDELAATFDHRGGITHQREAPWRVVQLEEFFGNTGMESVADVAIAYCKFASLPESENPWIMVEPARVSLNSFGGDVTAFENWQSRNNSCLI